MVLLQGVLREPSSSFSVVHSGSVVRERQACERLILLAVEPVAVVRNWQRCRVPAFSERIVVVAFEDVVLVCRHDAHTAQMIRHEITNLGFIVDRPHDPPAAEPRTLEYAVASGIRTVVCKRTPIRKTAVVGIHRSEFRTVYKITIIYDIRIVVRGIFKQIQTII